MEIFVITLKKRVIYSGKNMVIETNWIIDIKIKGSLEMFVEVRSKIVKIWVKSIQHTFMIHKNG